MKKPNRILGYVFTLFLMNGVSVLAQDEPPPPDPQPDYPSSSGSPTNNMLPPTEGELPPPKLPPRKGYSAAEKKKVCDKYEGKFVGYYDNIYKIEKCKRREVSSEEGSDSTSLLKGKKIEVVDDDAVAMLPLGLRLGESADTKPNCARLEGKYILSRGDDVYFIEKCKKRLLPDWDTYTDHAAKRGKRTQDIIELSEREFNRIPEGEELPSTLDAEYRKLLKDDSSIDILPLAEACKGLNGKFLSYYSKIYKIEKCRKLPVDPETFLKRFPKYKLDEMTSEQYVSLPTGKEVKL